MEITDSSPPRVAIRSITFSDDTIVNCDQRDVVVIVGPNNAGKSEALRGILNKAKNPAVLSPVVKSIELERVGSIDEVESWISKFATRDVISNPANPSFAAFGSVVHVSQIRNYWTIPANGLGELTRFMCHLLTSAERLTTANPADAIMLTSAALVHPIHFLQKYDQLEERISILFRRAFDMDLVVHRNAGSRVPLYVGDRPKVEPGEDRASFTYTQRLEKLNPIEQQGDGVRSFAGVLLHATVGKESILLIDEPEAFLHPPQARMLGRMLVEAKSENRQVLVATHSGDVLRGVLDGNAGSVRVVRVRRDGNQNHVKELDRAAVNALWVDPLLRSSNILDGVFHERVIVCEGDADARFFTAMADALFDGPLADRRKPDVMFTHCGGKGRLPLVVRSLKALDVPVLATPDFDILRDEHPLDVLVAAAGGDWSELRAHWHSVKTAIDSIRPQMSTHDVKDRVSKILEGIGEPIFPRPAKTEIENVLKQTSAWSLAKQLGRGFVPAGTPTQQYNLLNQKLRALGIRIIEVGELERFCPSIGGHGPSWAIEALSKDLINDPELEPARQYVTEIMS